MSEDIDTSTKLKEILRDFPELTDYLLEIGLCGCGDESLNWSVERAAEEKGMDLNVFLVELRRRIKE